MGEGKKEVIKYYEEEERSIQKEIEYYLVKPTKEDCDIIDVLYDYLFSWYWRYGELKYVAKSSVNEYKKYFYLSAKTVELCISLLNKRIPTIN